MNILDYMMTKKINYILCAGIVLCGIVSSPFALDRALVIRHIIWCLVTLALATFLLQKKKDIKTKNTVLFVVFLFYCMFTTFSIVKAANISESFYFILVSWLSLIFVFCVSSVVDKKIVIKAMMYFGLFLACFGLYQVIKYGSNLVGTRALGFTCGRNLWSSTLMLMLPFALYEAFNKNKIGILTAMILLVNIVCLQTRSVYLGLVVATIVTLFLYKKWLVIPVIISVVLCILCFSSIHNTYTLKTRLHTWTRTLKTFKDNPVFGVGAGNWKIATPKYGNGYEKYGDNQQFLQRAHNDFLEVLTESGFLGGLCYIGIFIVAIGYTLGLTDKILAWTMRFGIVSYMGIALFTFPKERALHSMLIFVIIGLVVHEHKRRKDWSEKRSIKSFVVCACLISILLAVNYQRHRTEYYMKKVDYAKSQQQWQKVIDLIDNNYSIFSTMHSYAVTPIYYYRAEANIFLKRNTESYEDFVKAYKLHPNHPAILWNIGNYKYSNKQYADARPYLNKAIRIMPHPSLLKQLESMTKR